MTYNSHSILIVSSIEAPKTDESNTKYAPSKRSKDIKESEAQQERRISKLSWEDVVDRLENSNIEGFGPCTF